jgi:hypothetical protein
MSADPWTDPDPKPGDFDPDLAKLDPCSVEDHEGVPDAKLSVLVGVEGEDAKRLERISEARGQKAADVVAALLRRAHARRPVALTVHGLTEADAAARPTIGRGYGRTGVSCRT